jgi:hypothetical protein
MRPFAVAEPPRTAEIPIRSASGTETRKFRKITASATAQGCH